MYQELAQIISNREVMPCVYLMKAVCPKIADSAKPGQYIMVKCDRGTERLLRRPISIHRTFDSGFELFYAVVGGGTQWLSQRRSGEKLDILGPLGNGFQIQPAAKNLLLVAGGIGIAPLVFLAEEALNAGKKVALLAGARTAVLLYPAASLPRVTDLMLATEDGSSGYKGLVTALLPDAAASADQICICGPLPMFKAIAANYTSPLINKFVQVSLEVRMGCGLGFCYACTIKTVHGLKQVCKDGPVFEMNDVLWAEMQ